MRGVLLSCTIRRTRLPRYCSGSFRPTIPYRPIGFPGGTSGYVWFPTAKMTLFPKTAAHGKYGDPTHPNSGRAELGTLLQTTVPPKTAETRCAWRNSDLVAG